VFGGRVLRDCGCGGARHEVEVIGFRGAHVVAMPLAATQGIRYGDASGGAGSGPADGIERAHDGRVLDALGRPLDGLAPLRIGGTWPLDGAVPKAMEREPIKQPLSTGVRVLDGMLTVGRGQRWEYSAGRAWARAR
jgi:flagellum-specific ATP synthase